MPLLKTYLLVLPLLLAAAACVCAGDPAGEPPDDAPATDLESRLGERYAELAKHVDLSDEQIGKLEGLADRWKPQEEAFKKKYAGLRRQHDAARAAYDLEAMKKTISRRNDLVEEREKRHRKQDAAIAEMLDEKQKVKLAAFSLYTRTLDSLWEVYPTPGQKAEMRRLADVSAEKLAKLLPEPSKEEQAILDAYRKEVIRSVLTPVQRGSVKEEPSTGAGAR